MSKLKSESQPVIVDAFVNGGGARRTIMMARPGYNLAGECVGVSGSNVGAVDELTDDVASGVAEVVSLDEGQE